MYRLLTRLFQDPRGKFNKNALEHVWKKLALLKKKKEFYKKKNCSKTAF